jgi:hypothetical protein
MVMHPEFCKRLVIAQLQEAFNAEGLFSDRAQLEEAEYPHLYIRFLNKHGQMRLIHFECTNYDFQAIAIEPVHPLTREALVPDAWMLRNGGAFPVHGMKDGAPFLCLQGTRDYYTHEGHKPDITGERWEKWRPEFKIRDLIEVIKQKFAAGEWE